MFNSSSDSQDSSGESESRYESTNEVKFVDHVLVEQHLEVIRNNVISRIDFVFPDVSGKYSEFCPTRYQYVRKIDLLGNEGQRRLTPQNKNILYALLSRLIRNLVDLIFGISKEPIYIRTLLYQVRADLANSCSAKLIKIELITEFIDGLCCELECDRFSLGVVACDFDPSYSGNLVVVRRDSSGNSFEEDGSKMKISFTHRIAYENIVDVRPSEVPPRFILVVEKMTMINDLGNSDFFQETPCVIICGGGQPTINCRLFVKMVHERLKVPIYAVIDCNPSGAHIFKSYKYGSRKLAFMSNNLVVASIDLLGIFHLDITAFGIKRKHLTKLSDVDVAKVENLLNEGWMKFEPNLYKSLKTTKRIGKKADVEIFTRKENTSWMDVIEKKISHSLQILLEEPVLKGSSGGLEEEPVLKGSSGGLVGLQNLGNTCYMNSSLQCLVHTPPLFDYFLKDFTAVINKESTSGRNGELAKAFGELLRNIWSSKSKSIQPVRFKEQLDVFCPQFSGVNQHDSHELLSKLVEGLHEDLNRVQPNLRDDSEDWHGLPGEEEGDVYWRCHKARNDSIILDVFQGLYKSTVVCSDCKYSSTSFEPFRDLSLPLLSDKRTIDERTMTVFVFYDVSGFLKPYSVTVLKNGVCKDLELAVASACCLKDDEGLLLAEVCEHTIGRYLAPLELLHSIVENKYIVAYRHPKPSSDSIKLEICHRYLDKYSLQWKFFLFPLVGYVKESGDTNLAVDRLLSPLKRKEFQSSAKEVYSEEKSDTLVKVILDWTEKSLELYDLRYFKDLLKVHKTRLAVKKTEPEPTSLISCLDAFLDEEILTNSWRCTSCQANREARKKIELLRLPKILVFQLKRFSGEMGEKLDTFVDFPLHNLDLTKYITTDASGQSYVYELYAISNHHGELEHGHYYTYSKLNADGEWYRFDDAVVSPLTEAGIRSHYAYLLFYERVKVELSGVGEPSALPGSTM